mgnify:FL=1|jgi:uncharacterized membrane protein YhaH (DUF805 family)|tara:strand:+ start:103 stop:519 length:417 start_codon:yes stop_codon:yes gene_type:complete
MEWFLKVVRDNYSNFSGRASRKEYWMFFLFYMIFAIVAMVADNFLGTDFTVGEGYYAVSMGYGWIYVLFMLALFIPTIAVMVRRLHDVGKSGWWWLINFIPLVGAIWFLVLMCTDSNPGDNKYGSSPKAIVATEEETA